MTLSTSAVAVCCWSRLAQLVEQPRVLDGDHGLVGKGAQQFALLVGESCPGLRRTTFSVPIVSSPRTIGTTVMAR